MDKDNQRYVCYALSRDGIRWSRPNLGLVRYHESTHNNLVQLDNGGPIPGSTSLVLYEPDEPRPERRFKMIREISPTQIHAAFSSDGLRWTEFAGNPVIRGAGSSRAVSSSSTAATTSTATGDPTRIRSRAPGSA
jgi:hypothetical protein